MKKELNQEQIERVQRESDNVVRDFLRAQSRDYETLDSGVFDDLMSRLNELADAFYEIIETARRRICD